MQKLYQLDFEHIEAYYAFTNSYDCYSDINFTSLMTWGGDVQFCIDQNGLIVVFPDYESDAVIITGLGEGVSAFKLMHRIEEMAREHSYIIDAVPRIVIDSIAHGTGNYQLSADQSDYVYIPTNQLQLAGSDYSWYRRKLSLLSRKYGDRFEVSIRKLTDFDQDTLNNFNQIWQNWTNNINDKEVLAIKRYIDYRQVLINQNVITIELDGNIAAYTFVESVHGLNSTCLIHYFKSNNAMEGMANFLFQEIAKFSDQNNLKYINFEQDVGEHGLRTFKSKLVPDVRLEKFTYVRD